MYLARRPHFVCALAVALAAGCGDPQAPPEPEAKVRLLKILRLYQVYADQNRKGPTDADALKAYGQKLTPQQRDEYLIGDDLESIWTSPRDGKPFEVKYNIRPDPSVTRAVAWEAVGKDGLRWVALSTGYVEEYDEETFRQYAK